MNNYPYTSTNNGTHTPQQYSPTATTSGATPSGTRPSPRPSACSTRLTWCATTTGIPRASRWSSQASGARASGRCRGTCVRTCVSRWGLEWGIIVDRAHDPPGENNTPTHDHQHNRWEDAQFTMVHLPGHTPGSVFIQFQERFLFTGDSLHYSRTDGRLTGFRCVLEAFMLCGVGWVDPRHTCARSSPLPYISPRSCKI